MSNLWAALQSLEMLSFPGKAVESQPLLGTTGGGGHGVSSRKPGQGGERALGSDPKSSCMTLNTSLSLIPRLQPPSIGKTIKGGNWGEWQASESGKPAPCV